MTLFIIGVVLMVVGFIGALFNIVSGFTSDRMFEDDGFKSVFRTHALFGALLVIGLALAVIGLVLLIV